MVLVCGALRCEAAPSLSFSGVRLGQKWDEFLKAHPKAKVSLDYDNGLTRAQAFTQERKKPYGTLIEIGKKPLEEVFYIFHNRVLDGAWFPFDFYGDRFVSKGLSDLKPSLQEIVRELGAPTSYGTMTQSGKYSGTFRESLLVWQRPTQCAFARVSWPLFKGRNPPTWVLLSLVSDPWRAPTSNWPLVLAPDREDKTRLRQLLILLEKIRPHSTDGMVELKPAAAIKPIK